MLFNSSQTCLVLKNILRIILRESVKMIASSSWSFHNLWHPDLEICVCSSCLLVPLAFLLPMTLFKESVYFSVLLRTVTLKGIIYFMSLFLFSLAVRILPLANLIISFCYIWGDNSHSLYVSMQVIHCALCLCLFYLYTLLETTYHLSFVSGAVSCGERMCYFFFFFFKIYCWLMLL